MSLNPRVSRVLAVVLLALLQAGFGFQGFGHQVAAAEGGAGASPWKFGVLADTQWSGNRDGQSPNSLPAGILQQINAEFIRHGVRFVVAVGDTVSRATPDNLGARALYAQDLYNAQIGFYPLRGNHEAGWAGPAGSGPEFRRAFPQTQNGVNNATPAYAEGLGVDSLIRPDPKTNQETFVVGANFSSPNLTCNGVAKAGLSYSFDFGNARCILLDQWDDSGSTKASTIAEQQAWLASRLAEPNRPPHVFVFGHKCVLGPKNKDSLFGDKISDADPGDGDGVDLAKLSSDQQAALQAKQAAADAFLGALAAHRVPFYLCGHDHLHFRSLITSPNGAATVQQIVGQSASNKFNAPQAPVSSREIPLAQEVNRVGFYIGTVDGPRVSIDYYAAPAEVTAQMPKEGSQTPAKPRRFLLAQTPDFTGQWKKRETFGYSLNGRTFVVPQGGTYAVVQDTTAQATADGEKGYLGTSATILAGTNGGTAATSVGKALAKAVYTGWSPASGTISDVFTLWGTQTVSDSQPDSFALSLSFQAEGWSPGQRDAGQVVLATKDGQGNWINAVEANLGGDKKFVLGAYDPRYPLGTHGVDPATRTAWAVVNYSGEFAVAVLPKSNPFEGGDHVVQQLNGDQEPLLLPAEMQLISAAWPGANVQMPYLVGMPEKDRLLLLLAVNKKAALIHSDDHGQTWSARQWLSVDAAGQPNTRAGGLTYVGQGKLVAHAGETNAVWASADYGQTWTLHALQSPTGRLSWWDPLLVVRDAAGRVERLVRGVCQPTGVPWGSEEAYSQGYLRSSADEGRSWSEPIPVPQWRGVHEINLLVAQNGDWVAACRTSCPARLAHLAIGRAQPGKEDFDFNDEQFAAAHFAAFGRRAGGAHFDHYTGLGVSISKDQGRTWSDMKVLYEWGRHHPSMVLLPDGRILMSYVVRIGYPDTAAGFPQFGVEAVVSRDHGQTWDLEHRYVLIKWVGRLQGEHAYHCSVQSTSTVLLPDGGLLTAFGTGFYSPETQRKKDVALIRWRLGPQ